MFRIRPVVERGNNFDGMLFLDKEDIGGIGRDEQGIYINLKRRLTLNETIELLKVTNGINQSFYQLEIEINYVK